MDDHHHQPIWPMLQGALDYILNIAGEAWAMLRKQNEIPREQSAGEIRERADRNETVVKQAGKDVKRASIGERIEMPEGSAKSG
ncbi:uncharacterized protein K460DRAFT_367218 [Cucurbitaria berberidis CBS 394.84]|uniref:Uncharacterized protein n=1 Tax=Cucurbitaria berberidis CBS 394.84 TaxID=1168544 RepID=A0A9P4L9J3_9PLEO|nr:uncharacterized protein K460DRAFT_367218 [Cucurbitaria berberidis CBS 394.84]KAF1846427.1 hypothetical protein K460DRAFT_367218 [Cucurbitaria berberidis CBS 394.84]